MPDLRFLNVRFNLDSPMDQAVYEGLTQYPSGERSHIVREALAAYLEVDRSEARRKQRTAKRMDSYRKRNDRIDEAPKNTALMGRKEKEIITATPDNAKIEHRSSLLTNSRSGEQKDEDDMMAGLLSMIH